MTAFAEPWRRVAHKNEDMPLQPARQPTKISNAKAAFRRRRRHSRRQRKGLTTCDRVLIYLAVGVGLTLLMASSILIHFLIENKDQEDLSTKASALWNWLGTKSMNPDHQSPPFAHKVYRLDPPSRPVLVVGLPKAGTSSLFYFFNCLGFQTQHWYCCGKQSQAQQDGMPAYMSDCMISNLQAHLPILDGCGEYDAYTELNGPRRSSTTTTTTTTVEEKENPRIFLPQHFYLNELYEFAPEAVWILNVRSVEDWIDSVWQIPANMLAKQLYFEAQFQEPGRWGKVHPFWDVQSQQHRPNRAFLKDFWEIHVQKVKEFVDTKPSLRLLIVNITNPDAGTQLVQDLLDADIPIPIQTRLMAGGGDAKADALISRSKACWRPQNVQQHG